MGSNCADLTLDRSEHALWVMGHNGPKYKNSQAKSCNIALKKIKVPKGRFAVMPKKKCEERVKDMLYFRIMFAFLLYDDSMWGFFKANRLNI